MVRAVCRFMPFWRRCVVSNKKLLLAGAAVALVLAGSVLGLALTRKPPAAPPAAAAPATTPVTDVAALSGDLKEVLAAYRKIIVLLADEQTLDAAQRESANTVGQALFHDNLARTAKIDATLTALVSSNDPARFDALDKLLAYIESDPELFDADRLAFREVLETLRTTIAKDGSLPAVKEHKRISEDLDAIAEIERNYEKEIRSIFDRFETRAIELKREKWSDYVAHLKKLYNREQILKDYGVVTPYPEAADAKARDENEEIFGRGLPKKTVVLTFDDGPHRVYSDEIVAILKQYDAPAIFFEVGRNLGKLDADGKPKLNGGAEVSRRLMEEGYAVGNHSFTHAQLSKESGDSLKSEIFDTDALLKAVDDKRSDLFRFPYGARNAEGRQLLSQAHLKSMMWNIDSLDWADPVPKSIADRVLRQVDKEGRGIILFHDIHERSVKALPIVLERLSAEGYQFAGWDGTGFKVPANAAAKSGRKAGHHDRIRRFVGGGDRRGQLRQMAQAAIRRQRRPRPSARRWSSASASASDHVFSLENADATRNNILATFHDKLAHGGVAPNDRIFVFFAGHGATRKLSSGRDLGYIVPADSDPNQFATDAIPMTEIQNIAESLTAKHVLFVMDACYSGLGLTRGGGNFLKENARRIGRQMLTAGGTDQLVADGGPGGHSIFSWTLLQGLQGKADLNGDGLITATELAAYVGPAVAAVSQQTPAFGSLPGSEGGDFVFELPNETEFLSPQNRAIVGRGDRPSTTSSTRRARPTPALSAAKPRGQGGGAGTGGHQGLARQRAEDRAAGAGAHPRCGNKRSAPMIAACSFTAKNNTRRAEVQFTEALKLRPDFALAANNLGFVYFKQEKFAEAARWFENTLKMDPSRAIAYLNLGDAYARSGQADKARAAFKTYLELRAQRAGRQLRETGVAKALSGTQQ